MESPTSGCVSADQVSHPLGRLEDEAVLVGSELTAVIFQFTPKSVQMHRVLHHRVIDDNEAHALTQFQVDWLGLRKLTTVETPGEPLHIAGEMKDDFASGQGVPTITTPFGIAEATSSHDEISLREIWELTGSVITSAFSLRNTGRFRGPTVFCRGE